MAYIKNTWTSGDIISSGKMNNIEDGIAAHDRIFESNSEVKEIYLKSSTAESTFVFKITVNDEGVLTATKVE